VLNGEDPGQRWTRRRPLMLAIVRTVLIVTGVVVLYYLLPLNRPFDHWTVIELVLGLVVLGLLVAWEIRAITRAQYPALRGVEAMGLIIPVFLLLFAAGYEILYTSDRSAFTEALTRTDTLYFVVTVFATVGFGDIAPVSEAARVLTTVQMLGDLLLIGLVLRMVLGAVQQGRRRVTAPADDPSRGRTPRR
jgi:voltage-gated potassium channel